ALLARRPRHGVLALRLVANPEPLGHADGDGLPNAARHWRAARPSLRPWAHALLPVRCPVPARVLDADVRHQRDLHDRRAAAKAAVRAGLAHRACWRDRGTKGDIMKGNRIHMSTNRIRVRTPRLLAATALVVPATLLSQDARTVADSLVHAADVAAYQSKPYEAIAAYERAIALDRHLRLPLLPRVGRQSLWLH